MTEKLHELRFTSYDFCNERKPLETIMGLVNTYVNTFISPASKTLQEEMSPYFNNCVDWDEDKLIQKLKQLKLRPQQTLPQTDVLYLNFARNALTENDVNVIAEHLPKGQRVYISFARNSFAQEDSAALKKLAHMKNVCGIYIGEQGLLLGKQKLSPGASPMRDKEILSSDEDEMLERSYQHEDFILSDDDQKEDFILSNDNSIDDQKSRKYTPKSGGAISENYPYTHGIDSVVWPTFAIDPKTQFLKRENRERSDEKGELNAKDEENIANKYFTSSIKWKEELAKFCQENQANSESLQFGSLKGHRFSPAACRFRFQSMRQSMLLYPQCAVEHILQSFVNLNFPASMDPQGQFSFAVASRFARHKAFFFVLSAARGSQDALRCVLELPGALAKYSSAVTLLRNPAEHASKEDHAQFYKRKQKDIRQAIALFHGLSA